MGTTFAVDNVEPATSPLRDIPYSDSLEGLLSAERLTTCNAYPPIEANSRPTSNLVAGIGYHPLVAALHLAYAGHRPIDLSPDMIWLLICQGVAHHLNANAEELRLKFVQHPGRLTLEARRDQAAGFIKGSAENPWPGAFAHFSAQIRAHIGPAHELFVPSFSTTGPAEGIAAEIVLLDSMKSYYRYLLEEFICGIPAITLEGSVADWRSIVERVRGFSGLHLEWWLAPLRPVLRQFAAAAAGEVDRAFWASIYRTYQPDEPCRSDSSLGWIGLFFPYLTQERAPSGRNPWLSGERDLDELLRPAEASQPSHPRRDLDSGYLHERQFPGGLAKAPFTWDERGMEGRLIHRWDMELLAGFVGIGRVKSNDIVTEG